MASVVLAGGGTAGHIEPALAVARQWMSQHPKDSCIFLGTRSGLETTLVPAAGFPLALIPKVSISRKPSLSWLKIPIDLTQAVVASYKVIKSADVLIGFGGYVSAPAYLAAKFAGVPTVIHEANAQPGWANRLGARFTKYLAVANPVEDGAFAAALLTGLPLRSDVATAFAEADGDWENARTLAKERMGFDSNKPLIFIMGGSQGSVAINTVVSQSLDLFNSLSVNVLHSVGQSNTLPAAHNHYAPTAYVHNMADAYLAADLVISRSGAVTCSEFRTLGRYALFVPLPIGNGEQMLNASSLVSSGRAVVIDQRDFTPEFLKASLADLLEQSSSAPIQGDGQDLEAAQKIAALAQFAMNS